MDTRDATMTPSPDGRADPVIWVGTSWKMTKTIAEALAYVRHLATVVVPPGLRVFVLPAHTALAAVSRELGPASPILVGAQNAHWAPEGAATGEVSMSMIRDAGAALVELGHSERRAAFGETDARIARKVRAAIDTDLTPLICVGEPQEVRESGGAEGFVTAQVEAALAQLAPEEVSRVLIAYEPIWAIGEQGRAASVDEVAPVIASLSEVAGALSSRGKVQGVLYGGSVNAGNVVDLTTAAGVDGVFVGRAAWDPLGMERLIALVAQARRGTTTSIDGRTAM